MAKFIQLFRNQLTNVFADKATAKAALESNKIDPKVLKDGMPIIARYYTNGPSSAIKTLLGIAHNNGQSAIVTVFDSGSIDELDYTDTAVTGSYVSKVDETDGVISVTREELPTVAAITETGKPIVAVAEDKGTISASAGTINAEFVNFAKGEARKLKIYGSDDEVVYDPQKRIGVMRSKIGASKAISLGAYAFALSELDK